MAQPNKEIKINIKNDKLPKAIQISIPNQIPMVLFYKDRKKKIPKVTWTDKRTPKAKTEGKKTKGGGIMRPDYRAIVVKTVCHWHKKTYRTMEQN